jgi:putative SOS response-associated peptidase YedK
MCNDFGNHVPYSDSLAAFSQTRIPVRWPAAAPNLEPREDIWPTDNAPVLRRLEDGTNEFIELRWDSHRPGRKARRSSIFARRGVGFRSADV